MQKYEKQRQLTQCSEEGRGGGRLWRLLNEWGCRMSMEAGVWNLLVCVSMWLSGTSEAVRQRLDMTRVPILGHTWIWALIFHFRPPSPCFPFTALLSGTFLLPSGERTLYSSGMTSSITPTCWSFKDAYCAVSTHPSTMPVFLLSCHLPICILKV